MIPIIPLGGQGITAGVYKLMGLMKDHLAQVSAIAAIHDGQRNYSFVVLFREKGSIGSFVAFINEWGTNDGLSGAGGGGFTDMMRFLEDHNCAPETYDLSLMPGDFLDIVGPDSRRSTSVRLAAWREIVFWMCESMDLPQIGFHYTSTK